MKRLKVPMNLQKNLKITQRVPKKSLLILIGEQSNRKWMSTILFHPIEKLMIVSVRTLKKTHYSDANWRATTENFVFFNLTKIFVPTTFHVKRLF